MEKGGIGAIDLTSFSTSLKRSWARRASKSQEIWATILKSKISSNRNICYIRKDDLHPSHKALIPIADAFEKVVDKLNKNLHKNKALLTLTPLSLIECVSKSRPRGKLILVKPTRTTPPELWRNGRICKHTPLHFLDRLKWASSKL